MMDVEVTPLHGPALALRGYFVCNINGEVSLWNMNGTLRVYTARSCGAQVIDLVEAHEKHLEILDRWPTMRDHAEILRRNMDTILVYAAMLKVEP